VWTDPTAIFVFYSAAHLQYIRFLSWQKSPHQSPPGSVILTFYFPKWHSCPYARGLRWIRPFRDALPCARMSSTIFWLPSVIHPAPIFFLIVALRFERCANSMFRLKRSQTSSRSQQSLCRYWGHPWVPPNIGISAPLLLSLIAMLIFSPILACR